MERMNTGVFPPVPFESVLMSPDVGERTTYVLDAETGKRHYVSIRPVNERDKGGLSRISDVYKPEIRGEAVSYVMVTKTQQEEVVEGALQVSVGRYHNAKSLSVDGLDSAPENMADSGKRRLRMVGVRLLEHAALLSRKMGCDGRLHIQPRDQAAANFYESLSFEGDGLVRDRGGYYFLPKKKNTAFREGINKKINAEN